MRVFSIIIIIKYLFIQMTKFNKGFTLIELLVVIAIIGILSSVVLASLNTARAKGADAAVKSAMASFRSQAALYYDTAAQSYGTGYGPGACVSATNVTVFGTTSSASIVTNINSNAGSASQCMSIAATGFIMITPLKGGGNWCVDANNAVATSAATIAAGATYMACQ